MKLVIIALALISTTEVNSYVFNPPRVTLFDESIYNQIILNKPDVDKQIAKKLTIYVNKYARKYDADPYRAIAIAMQESGYRNISTLKRGSSFDVGMFQINIRTIKEYGFDKNKIMNDLEYSVESYFKVVSNKKKMCKSLKKDAWVCYHSKNKYLRQKYKNMVNRYYPKKGSNEKKIANNQAF